MMFSARKILILVLTLAFALSLFACGDESEPSSESSELSESESSAEIESSSSLNGEESSEITSEVPQDPQYETVDDYFEDVPYVGLYNADDLTAYYTESADEHIYPASLTKLVTSAVALKYATPELVCVVGDELDLVQPHSSLFGLRKGMELTLEDLLYGLLLPSGNDAAYVVAVNVVRNIEGKEKLTDIEAVEYFCGLMNEHCAEIGANDSFFVNPEGWDDERQYTTINDLAKIASYALGNDLIAEIVSTPQRKFMILSGETYDISNSNLLIHPDSDYYKEEVIGMKTGTTDLAGACLVSCVSIEDEEYILICTGCDSNSKRYETILELIDIAYAFHYESDSIPVVVYP